MALRANHVKATALGHAVAQFNVGTAASHVRRNRDRARLSGALHDLRFLHMKLRVEHVVRNFLALEHSAQQLGSFYTDCADEHRLVFGVAFSNFVDDGVVFLATRLVDAIVGVFPHHRSIGRNNVDVEFVNVVKLGRFGLGRAGHAGELLIEPEIILDRDGGERLRLAIYLHAFLGLHRLVQTVAPTAPRHFATGEFIDNHHFVVLDDVLHIFLEQAVGAQ